MIAPSSRIGFVGIKIATCCLFIYNAPVYTHVASVADALSSQSSCRRRFVISAVGGVLTSAAASPSLFGLDERGSSILSTVSHAAPPITKRETDSLLAISKRKFRKKPPKILRRKLNLDFAVLLMRSSYNALDELDCVGMDQFQRDFFLIRGSEYEEYTNAIGDGLVKQGDLTDPYYFDFISFAQYQTINRELTLDPLVMFEEMQPVEPETDGSDASAVAKFVPVVIKRDPAMTNEMLVPTHSSRVGAAILDRLIETFDGTASRIPNMDVLFGSEETDTALLLEAIRQLVNLFLIGGYAFDAVVTMQPSTTGSIRGTEYTITLSSPVTLWGGQVLQKEGSAINNSFVQKTVTEFLRRSSCMCTSTIKYDGTKEVITVTII